MSKLHLRFFYLISTAHKPIHPIRIAIKVLTATIAHKITPCKSGRAPTCLIVLFDIPVPIKNNVTVSPILPRWLNTGYAGAKMGA